MRPLDIEEIKRVITESSEETEIFVGCDSQVFKKGKRKDRKKNRGKYEISFARVVVVHMNGNNGCMVFGDVVTEPDYGNLKQRLMKEVGYATGLGYELVDVIGNRPMSIHLDINTDPMHKSNVAMKEAIGWVRGMFGFDPVLKPDAWASMCVADHYVRH